MTNQTDYSITINFNDRTRKIILWIAVILFAFSSVREIKRYQTQKWIAAHTSLVLGDEWESFEHTTYYSGTISQDFTEITCAVEIKRMSDGYRKVKKIILPGGKTLSSDSNVYFSDSITAEYNSLEAGTWIITINNEPAGQEFLLHINGAVFSSGDRIASVNGMVYHAYGCSYVEQISGKNLIRITPHSASLYGLEPCEKCGAYYNSKVPKFKPIPLR